jgi:CRISPR/Cas system-associated protein Cas7 (RAMP superfamily)
MNYEVACNPIPGADVPGYKFRRDQNGTVIARCVACSVGFVVREGHAANVRRLMNVHQLHVCKPSLGDVLSGCSK